jgi:hypothetical protein
MTKANCWNQEKVTKWLEEKEWGQFALVFESKKKEKTNKTINKMYK